MSKTSKYWKVGDRRFRANQYCAFSQLSPPPSDSYQGGRAEYFRLGSRTSFKETLFQPSSVLRKQNVKGHNVVFKITCCFVGTLFRIISGHLIQMTLAIMKYGLKGECFSTCTISDSNLINYLKKNNQNLNFYSAMTIRLSISQNPNKPDFSCRGKIRY